jgi:hypothetical protein
MNPNNITLTSLNLSFEYEKLARELDTINDLNDLRNLSKYFIKMYLQQQEVITSLGSLHGTTNK